MSERVDLFEPIPIDRFQVLSKESLIQYIQGQQDLLKLAGNEIRRLKLEVNQSKEFEILVQEQLLHVREELYGKSSEKRAPSHTTTGEDFTTDASSSGGDQPQGDPKPKRKKVQLPSERYPNVPLIEREITLVEPPQCSCCGERLVDSGMTEDLEYIKRVPASFQIIREKKHKYNCSTCHGDIQTASALPRIKPGSSYSDETIIDVGVSKFCDLIPIDRQVKMAERLGFIGLPPQSLIETTHYLAAFLKPLYERLKTEVLSARVLHADETPHRMLEGAEKENWYFWGFSSKTAAYFEAHDTRSGDVAIEFLKNSQCEYLMSDVYSGYSRSTTVANEDRTKNKLPLIKKIYCNAHARRKFIEAEVFEESLFFIERYQRIYVLEGLTKDQPPDKILVTRAQMRPYFEEMKAEALRLMCSFSSKSSIVKAFKYFLRNYEAFTHFISSVVAPIDNNSQEALLRNPVIGRKTWYGTHSVRGAETTVILFSVIESCKLNKVNPREYLARVTEHIHNGKTPPTPAFFKAT